MNTVVTTLQTEQGLTGKALKSGALKWAACTFAAVRKDLKAQYPDKTANEFSALVETERKRRVSCFRAGFDLAIGEARRCLNESAFTLAFNDETGALEKASFALRATVAPKVKAVTELKLTKADKAKIDALMLAEVSDFDVMALAVAKPRKVDASRLVKAVTEYAESVAV